MAFSTETIGQLLASGRHYVSTTAGFIGGIGLMSAAQSKGLGDAFSEIFDGIGMIIHGSSSAWAILVVAFPVIGGVMAKFASKSASLPNQAAAIKAAVQDPNTPVSAAVQKDMIEATVELPKVQTIVVDKTVADEVPSASVVAADEVKVVPAT